MFSVAAVSRRSHGLSLVQRNLTEYFVAVDVNNMLQLYASMLHERRVLVTSSKLSAVSTSLFSSEAAGVEHSQKGLPASADGEMFCVLLRQYLHAFLIYDFNLALEVQKSNL